MTEKRHDSVKRTIETLVENGVISKPQIVDGQKAANGVTEKLYLVGKRDSFVVVAQLCPEFTARLVDRWQELENKASKPAELSRMDILKLAMESEQAREKAEAERDHAIATKALIGSKREATAMATASAAKAEAAKLRDKMGHGMRQASVRAVTSMTGRSFDWLPMRRWCKERNIEAAEVLDPLYGTVKAWPALAWMDCHGIDLAEMFD